MRRKSAKVRPPCINFGSEKGRFSCVASRSACDSAGYLSRWVCQCPNQYLSVLDNTSAMGSRRTGTGFIFQHVVPELMKHREMLWFRIGAKGPPETMPAIDTKIYTRNRAFRLTYACKDGSTHWIRPWDEVAWREIKFDSPQAREVWLEEMLVSGADEEYATVLCSSRFHSMLGLIRKRKKARVAVSRSRSNG